MGRAQRLTAPRWTAALRQVSDHECGGLTVGEGGDYLWNPDVLAKVRNSSDVVARCVARASSARGWGARDGREVPVGPPWITTRSGYLRPGSMVSGVCQR